MQSSTLYVSDSILHCIILQKTYSVIDCFFIDHAITGNNQNTYWTNYSTRTEVGTTGTKVTGETFISKTVGGIAIVWTEDIGVEFNLVSKNNTYVVLQLYDGTNICNYRLTDTGKVTIENKVGVGITVKLNGETVTPLNASKVTTTYRIGLQLGNSTELVFKDWIMYPI